MALKMEGMWDSVFEELKIHFPHIYNDAIHWYPIGRNHILVRVSDRSEYIFDWENKRVYLKKSYSSDGIKFDESAWREQFAKQLRSMMWFKGVLLYDLVERTGISHTTISKYLNAKATPSGTNLELIARALNCTTIELTYFEQ